VSVEEYEYSALLYLTEIGVDFDGGSLVFHDAEKDCHVSPSPGALPFEPPSLPPYPKSPPFLRILSPLPSSVS